ncbi:MAG: hypothetical protein DRP57_08150 [Spirochaetes bacterium]|nr:MAG: hypothetical protein DRP57_08150 [Spirochaetota bacterium]
MIALLLGIVFVLFAVYSILPFSWSLNWWNEVLAFLKGGIPIFALLVGAVSVFVGIADIKDKIEAKKEELEEDEKTETKQNEQ